MKRRNHERFLFFISFILIRSGGPARRERIVAAAFCKAPKLQSMLAVHDDAENCKIGYR